MPESATRKATTILNVDADAASRAAVTQLFERAGLLVCEATTAAETLSVAATGPDLIVLELRLPDAPGLEVCRRLKACPATATIPLLVLSEECGDSQCRVACFEAGAEACLARPFADDELVAQVRTLLRLRRAEQLSRERLEEVEKLLDVLPVAVWIAHDPACQTMTGNQASYKLLELPPQTNVSVTAPAERRPAIRHFRDGRELAPDELPMQYAAAHAVEVRDAELELLLPGGLAKHVYGSAAPLLDASGAVRGCVGAFMELTERKRVEQALRASERRFKTLAGSAPVGIFETDADGNCLFVNDRWRQMAGMSLEAARGQGWAAALHPEDRERIFLAWNAAAREGCEFAEEYRFCTPQGEVTWLSGRAVALSDESGAVSGYLGTVEDISRLKRAEAELRMADQRKDEFLAMLAHELRNPLAPIRNAVEILKLEGPPDPKLVWARGVIDRQVEQMARLLDDLLDVSRVSLGQLRMRKQPVDLTEVVRSALETSRPSIAEMGHELSVVLPEEPVFVGADLSRLAQAFLNLLNNAAKYTDRGGRIVLTARRQGSDVVVSVKDNGIGISAELLPHVFDMFMQANHSAERSQGGLGIGLSLVKRLIEAHGGTVEARSEGPGRGAEFIVRLPVVMAPPESSRSIRKP